MPNSQQLSATYNMISEISSFQSQLNQVPSYSPFVAPGSLCLGQPNEEDHGMWGTESDLNWSFSQESKLNCAYEQQTSLPPTPRVDNDLMSQSSMMHGLSVDFSGWSVQDQRSYERDLEEMYCRQQQEIIQFQQQWRANIAERQMSTPHIQIAQPLGGGGVPFNFDSTHTNFLPTTTTSTTTPTTTTVETAPTTNNTASANTATIGQFGHEQVQVPNWTDFLSGMDTGKEKVFSKDTIQNFSYSPTIYTNSNININNIQDNHNHNSHNINMNMNMNMNINTTSNTNTNNCLAKIDTRKIASDKHLKCKSEEKPAPAFGFKCEVCEKPFDRRYNLSSHMRTHTNERPFACRHPGCTWKFARTHDLKRHSGQHSDFKPHACPSCPKRFARGDALKRHWKVDKICKQPASMIKKRK